MSRPLPRPRTASLALGGGVLAAALWWRKHPSACPYRPGSWVEPPHPLITRRRLRDALDPQPGERVLEVGPGTGCYSLDVAGWVSPDGQLDIFDVQQEMLDHTMRRAAERGLANVTPTQGDARRLPCPDASFAAAYLTAVLGEIPDQDAALRETRARARARRAPRRRRALRRPALGQPKRLRQRADAAGLTFTRRSGAPLGYFALFNGLLTAS